MSLTILTAVRFRDNDAPSLFSSWTYSGSGRGGGEMIVYDRRSNFAIGKHFSIRWMCRCINCLRQILTRKLIIKLGLLGRKLGLLGWKLELLGWKLGTFEYQGPVSLTFSPSQFKFVWKFWFTLTSILLHDRYNILYLAWKLCCRGMCKNLLRSDGQQRYYKHG